MDQLEDVVEYDMYKLDVFYGEEKIEVRFKVNEIITTDRIKWRIQKGSQTWRRIKFPTSTPASVAFSICVIAAAITQIKMATDAGVEVVKFRLFWAIQFNSIKIQSTI